MFYILFLSFLSFASHCFAVDYVYDYTHLPPHIPEYLQTWAQNNAEFMRGAGMDEEYIKGIINEGFQDEGMHGIVIPKKAIPKSINSAFKAYHAIRAEKLYSQPKFTEEILEVIDGRGSKQKTAKGLQVKGISTQKGSDSDYDAMFKDILAVAASNMNNAQLVGHHQKAIAAQTDVKKKYHVNVIYYLIGYLRNQMGYTSGNLLINRLFGVAPNLGDRNWATNKLVFEKKALDAAKTLLRKPNLPYATAVDLAKNYPDADVTKAGVIDTANKIQQNIRDTIKTKSNAPINNYIKVREIPNVLFEEVKEEQHEVEALFDKLFGKVDQHGNFSKVGEVKLLEYSFDNPPKDQKDSNTFFDVFLCQDYMDDKKNETQRKSRARQIISAKGKIKEYWSGGSIYKGDGNKDNIMLRRAFVAYLKAIEENINTTK